MLPKANRLKIKGEFKRALSGQRLCGNSLFVLYGLAVNSTAGSFGAVQTGAKSRPPRVGFIVSKKVHKRATRRNRIRRRMRELVRLHLKADPQNAFPGYRALVFIARSGSAECSFQEMKQHMERCLKSMRP